jgi:MFS transporter, DHA2 family, multidrug resistance protein
VATILAPAAAVPRRPAAGKWTVSLSVLVGALMSTIDTSIVNVALVHIEGTYGVNAQEVTWVSAAYLISVVIMMPLTAWLSAVLGRRTLYLYSVALFTVASGFCGLSTTFGQLIFFRVIQGLGGGALLPVAQAIISETFPPEEQGQAMGMFGLIVLLGPAVGPVLGGWLTDSYAWPWIFFINLPIGPLALFLISRFVQDPPYMRRRSGQHVDIIGIGLLAIGLAALVTVLEQGERAAWFQSPFITLTTAVTVLALVAFVLWELHTPMPAADLRILKNVSFASATLIGGIVWAGFFGGFILLPLFLQLVLNYSATEAGLALMPRALSMLVVVPVAGAFYNRVGARVMLSGGLILTGFAGWLMAHYTLAVGPLQLLTANIIQGVGFAFMFVSLTTAALSTIPRPLVQSAAGLNSLIRQLGASIGTAVVITVLDYKTTTASAELVRYANIYNPIFRQWWQTYQNGFLAHGNDPFTAHQRAVAVLQGLIYQQATMVAYAYDFALLGVLFALCLPLVALVRSGGTQPGSHVAEI